MFKYFKVFLLPPWRFSEDLVPRTLLESHFVRQNALNPLVKFWLKFQAVPLTNASNVDTWNVIWTNLMMMISPVDSMTLKWVWEGELTMNFLFFLSFFLVELSLELHHFTCVSNLQWSCTLADWHYRAQSRCVWRPGFDASHGRREMSSHCSSHYNTDQMLPVNHHCEER